MAEPLPTYSERERINYLRMLAGAALGRKPTDEEIEEMRRGTWSDEFIDAAIATGL